MTNQIEFNDDYDSNNSGNSEFHELLNKQITRRDLIKKTAGGAVALTVAASVTGCSDDNNEGNSVAPTPEPKPESELKFTPVQKNIDNAFTVADGYEARVLFALGDPIINGVPGGEWDSSGKGENIPSGASFTLRSGECHDGMTYFGMSNYQYDANASARGLLVMNHEYVDDADIIHPVGHTHGLGPKNIQAEIGLVAREEDESLREINCHGISILEVFKNPANQSVVLNKSSLFNRRLTAASPIELSGPVKGNELVKNRLSPKGDFSFGTINNCGNGYTPWGTYLTTEENFNQYFSHELDTFKEDDKKRVALARYKIPALSQYKWHTTVATKDSLASDITKHGKVTVANMQDLYDRWMVKNTDSSKESATDFRHADNTFGWIVEIDPFDSDALPVKRTALGRFAHEDCRVSRAIEGQPLAFYMGDDSRGEYIYKFVSDALWDPKDINAGYSAGKKYMDSGKIYVAKFNFDETSQKALGEWIELNIKNPLISGYATYKFADQADVLVNIRLAADAVGATKMDRPEWVAVNPHNGEVYVTLTNNSERGTKQDIDAANPRQYVDDKAGKEQVGNVHGHIIRFREDKDVVTATTFEWDIFLFGAEADADTSINLSGLTDNNDFSSPDGMWFDPRGVLWIQTDDGAYTDKTNCMMLAALPGKIGDGEVLSATAGDKLQKTPAGTQLDDTKLRRFLTGPSGCEITGVTMTPDYKAIFVNVQHPGGVWPSNHTNNLSDGKGERPRSATVVITRKDGGEIAGEGLVTETATA